MSVAVKCPNPACGASQHVAEKSLGRRARCRRCGQDFTLAAASYAGAVPVDETLRDRSAAAQPRGQAAAVQPLSSPDTCELAPLAEPPPTAAFRPGAGCAVPAAGANLPARFSRFEVRSCIGAGAAGVVYRAFDPLLGRDVALKVPKAAVLDNPQAVARFLREPRAAAQLRHPHIVPVYDAGTDHGRYYIASAYIEGRTLEHRIADGRPDFRRAAEIVMDLADALHYAHGLGVVHRDVKPANIMLDVRSDVLLMDFGLARFETGEKLTHDGTVLGTPAYMAPEQASVDFGEVGPASDQYSLGVVLYELLCGARPFHGPPPVVIFNVLHEQPSRPRAIDPAVPRDLETIALKAMSKRSADRYADCRALADDLRRWLEDRPIVARQMGAVERTVRWAKKRPALAALAATVLLSAVVSTWFALALERRGEDLRLALADARAHAERLQKANEAIRERDASLEQRQAALNTAEVEIATTREALEGERRQVAAKDEELQRQLDENERIAKERDVAQSAKEIAESTATEATKARDEVAKSDAGWTFYKTKLLAAQAALREGNEVEARALLKACPNDHRSWEWKILWSRSHGGPTTWTWTGGDGGGQASFNCGGKILAVHSYIGKTVNERGKRVYKTDEILTLLDSSTGREIASVPRLGPYALHPDGKTIAIAKGGTTVIEYPLDADGVDVELASREQKSIEWLGYHPNGAQLYFIERGADDISVRTIDCRSRQLTQVATLATPPKDGTRKSELAFSRPRGKFAPDDRFFLLHDTGPNFGPNWGQSKCVREVANNGTLGPPRTVSESQSDDLLIRGVSRGYALQGTPIALSPDGKRLASVEPFAWPNKGAVAIWNVRSPDPQSWERVVGFSDVTYRPGGAFGNPDGAFGPGLVFSEDWTRAAFIARNIPDHKNPTAKARRLQKITVELWNEPVPDAAEDEEIDPEPAREER